MKKTVAIKKAVIITDERLIAEFCSAAITSSMKPQSLSVSLSTMRDFDCSEPCDADLIVLDMTSKDPRSRGIYSTLIKRSGPGRTRMLLLVNEPDSSRNVRRMKNGCIRMALPVSLNTLKETAREALKDRRPETNVVMSVTGLAN